jgi:hypothetical protein
MHIYIEKYTGKVYVYECCQAADGWFVAGTIYSPWVTGATGGEGVVKTGDRTERFKKAQGFGYKVALQEHWLLASTANNNGRCHVIE